MSVHRARGVRFAIGIVALALSLAFVPTAAASRTRLIGVNQGLPLDGADIQKIGTTNVRTVRFLLSWTSVQPSQGGFRWRETDALVGRLASRGIAALPFVWGSPRWVAGTPARPPIDSVRAKQAWRNFLEAAVTRYGPGGEYWAHHFRQQFGEGVTPEPIRAWQVWTEPNGKAYIDPRPSAKRYAELLRISHDAIRSQDPHARIVLAGLVGLRKWRGHVLEGVPGWRFLRRLYRIPGIKREYEVAALHPYSPNLDQLRRQLKLTRAVMKKHGEKRTSLWITELGWGSAPRGSGHSVLDLNKGIDGQRRLLRRSFKLILDHRRTWRTRRVFWYDWRDPPKDAQVACAFCASAGLLRNNRDPKPAYRAFRRFTAAD